MTYWEMNEMTYAQSSRAFQRVLHAQHASSSYLWQTQSDLARIHLPQCCTKGPFPHSCFGCVTCFCSSLPTDPKLKWLGLVLNPFIPDFFQPEFTFLIEDPRSECQAAWSHSSFSASEKLFFPEKTKSLSGNTGVSSHCWGAVYRTYRSSSSNPPAIAKDTFH